MKDDHTDETCTTEQAEVHTNDALLSKVSTPSQEWQPLKQRRARSRKRKEYNVVKFRVCYSKQNGSSETSFLSSLHTIRLDPVSLCMTDLADPAVKAVFHRITTYFFPTQVTIFTDPSTWLERANASPVLYNAMLWGWSHPEYLTPEQRRVIKRYYDTAIKNLIKFTESETIATDEVLLAVALLSITERPAEPAGFGLFVPPLKKLHCVDLVERLYFVEPHRSAVKRLVAEKGGLTEVSMPGVAEALQNWELYDSVRRLRPPEFELCNSSLTFLEEKVIPLRTKPLTYLLFPSSGPIIPSPSITGFSTLSLNPQTLTLLHDISHLLTQISLFTSGALAPSAADLGLHRNLLTYRLLALTTQENELAEICRIAVLLFWFCVGFPLSEWGHKEALVGEMERRVVNTENYIQGSGGERSGGGGEGWKSETERGRLEFLLWACMAGAVVRGAQGVFVDYLVEVSGMLGLEEWKDVKRVMARYLWLDEACDDGSQIVWREVIRRRTATIEGENAELEFMIDDIWEGDFDS